MAKRFFYVCAGLLCLALTYHAGARNATAQAPAECFGIDSERGAAVVVGRMMYVRPLSPFTSPPTIPQPVPGTEAVIACAPFSALLANGDVYHWTGEPTGWTYSGSVYPLATSAEQSSWGSVKARYRDAAPRGVKPGR
jgi:hypothetical protein